MTQTENYYLKKPSYSDPIDVGDLNDNFDAIDDIMKTNADSIFGKYTKPSGGIPESDLSAVVRRKLDAQGTTVISAETQVLTHQASLSNFKIDGIDATESEVGAKVLEDENVVFVITETNIDGAGTHATSKFARTYFVADTLVNFTCIDASTDLYVVEVELYNGSYSIQLVEQALFGSGILTLTYDNAANKIKNNGVEKNFSQIKNYMNAMKIVQVKTTNGVFLHSAIVSNDRISFGAVAFPDVYTLDINNSNVVTYTENVL